MKENRKDRAENTEYCGNSTPSCDSSIVEFSCGKGSLRKPSESLFIFLRNKISEVK